MFKKRSILAAFVLLPTICSADVQADRQGFIQRMTNNGIFLSTSIEEGVPQLVVMPNFYDSDLESKQTAVRIVYQYYTELDSAHDILIIIDSSTGAQVGVYTADGLQL